MITWLVSGSDTKERKNPKKKSLCCLCFIRDREGKCQIEKDELE